MEITARTNVPTIILVLVVGKPVLAYLVIIFMAAM